MGALLGIPPRFMLVIILAIAAYVVYRMVSTETTHTMSIIILVLLGIVLVRTLFRMRPKAKVQEDEDD